MSSLHTLRNTLRNPFPSFRYHPHQEEGVRWMMSRETEDRSYCSGGILADEMGLGKTWQTIGLILNNPVPLSLILVPPVLQSQWSAALKQSDIPHRIVMGGKKTDKLFSNVKGGREDVAVILSTYDRAAMHAKELNELGIERILADEGHVFRNGPSTRRFREIEGIEATYRWILSGTPIQNRIQDFINLLKWLHADYDRETSSLKVIAECILLRRTVADVREVVQEFPDAKPRHFIHPVMMPEDGLEKQVFDRLVRRFQNAMELQAENWMILELYLRIRQFLAHPQVYIDAMNKKYKADYCRKVWEDTASKMAKFEQLMCGSAKQPTIIFTTFKTEMEFAEKALMKAGYKTWTIQGGMSDGARDAAIHKSREAVEGGEQAVAMLIQIQAGNAGLNLQHLTRVFFLSSHWNPSVVDQAIGRSYRIGQSAEVEVHHILLADGAEKNLDRYMAKLHNRKRAIAKAVNPALFCDSAVEAEVVLESLNEVCPDEAPEDVNDDDVEDAVAKHEEKERAKVEKANAKAEKEAAKVKAKADKAAEKAAAKEAKALRSAAEKAAAKLAAQEAKKAAQEAKKLAAKAAKEAAKKAPAAVEA
jgi:SNF2 family DNA or RNA helicase